MKVIQTVTEVSGEGLESLLGKRVILFCANYFYTGKLVGVNTNDVKLEDPAIVYETGAFSNKNYTDEQKIGTKFHYVRIGFIESYGEAK